MGHIGTGRVDPSDPRYVIFEDGRRLARVRGGENTPGEPPATPDASAATEPAEPAAAAPTPEPAAPAGDGPWASVLTERFPDEGVRTQVDTFLRDTVQPHVTRLEQERPPSEAAELWDSLRNPEQVDDTVIEVIAEIYGEDAATAIENQLFGEEGGGGQPTGDPAAAAAAQQAGVELPPEVQELVSEREAEKQREQYDQAFEGIKAQHPDDFKSEKSSQLFAPFVLAAGGDHEAAYPLYKEWLDDFKATYGVSAEAAPQAAAADAAAEAGEPQVPNPDDVPTLGTTGGATTAPPTAKDYSGEDGLEEAIDDWFAEERAGEAPPVGTA